MTKVDLVAYLANITFIMDHHERLGTTKNKFLIAEFMARQGELHTMLQKEQEDEARNRKQQSQRNESRTEVSGR